MPIIDNAVYVGGIRTQNPESLDETYEVMRERGGMAWIGLYRPEPVEVRSVADEFSLHHLAVNDALAGHQRAKLERYGDTLFIVLRPATYDDDSETVIFGELHVFVGQGFVVTIRHAENPDLTVVRQRMEADVELVELGRPRGGGLRGRLKSAGGGRAGSLGGRQCGAGCFGRGTQCCLCCLQLGPAGRQVGELLFRSDAIQCRLLAAHLEG